MRKRTRCCIPSAILCWAVVALWVAGCAEPEPDGGLGFDESDAGGNTSLRESPRPPGAPTPDDDNSDNADAGLSGSDAGTGSDDAAPAETEPESGADAQPDIPTSTPEVGSPDTSSPDVTVAEPDVAAADPNCNNACLFAYDGLCDDGGDGADSDFCELGSDCDDCGTRDGSDPDPDPGTGAGCTNTCTYDHDGDCDDGGPGSDYDFCDLGTDCADCGPRDDSGGGGGGGGLCEDSCEFFNDGECDDGGLGSDWSICELGTDCTDCGPR